MSPDSRQQQIDDLRAQLRKLEAELQSPAKDGGWPPKQFYTEYYATSGFILGMIAAAFSLLINVVGAPVAGKSPLELIRIYLTFPLGAPALQLMSGEKGAYVIGDGVILAIGCCLYLATGMLLGVPYFVVLSWLTDGQSTMFRVMVSSVLATLLWLVNFYCILSWLQPALLGGNWIVDPRILPPWVALVTHLIFGWTLALLYPWGKFQPYRQPNVAVE